MNTITLSSTLPRVFEGMQTDEPVASSQVWLKELIFQRGEIYNIEAESGTGKSSLCSFIYGSRGDYSGDILFDGVNVKSFSISQWCQLRRTALAYLPQEMNLFPNLTVIENIQIKNHLTNHKDLHWIHQALERLEIDHKLNSPAAKLSVGQQQRVAIVRALCQPFDFILLDEPVSHLDSRNNSIVASLICEEAASRQAAIISTSVGNNIQIAGAKTIRL